MTRRRHRVASMAVLGALLIAAAVIAMVEGFPAAGQGQAIAERSSQTGLSAPTARTPPPAASASTASRPLQSRFDEADDLHALLDELLGASAAGDGEASRIAAMVYEECWTFSVNPEGFIADGESKARARPDLARAIRAAHAWTAARCDGFRTDKLESAGGAILLKKAAQQGDLAAEALLFSRATAHHGGITDHGALANYQLDLAKRIVRSGDAEAFAALSTSMGPSSVTRVGALGGLPSGFLRSEAAWQIAACRLGRACGPRSPAVQGACVFGGICGFGNMEDLYTKGLLPASEERRLSMEVRQLMEETSR